MITYNLDNVVTSCGTNDPRGIYDGSGVIPSNTNATITDQLTFSNGSVKIDDLGGTGD